MQIIETPDRDENVESGESARRSVMNSVRTPGRAGLLTGPPDHPMTSQYPLVP